MVNVEGLPADAATDDWAGISEVTPRPGEDLEPLLTWLRLGRPAGQRLDFPAGTALPDGRLDLCKQQVGPLGAARIAAALPRVGPDAAGPVRHLLLGTDGLGDSGADAVADGAGERGVRTLYLGCNKITAAGACRIASRLRQSPQSVRAVWLKRNPLGAAGGSAAAELIGSAPLLRTLDLVQTGLEPTGLAEIVDALIAAAGSGREFERLYAGGNPLGVNGAGELARLIRNGSVAELYVSASGLGDTGALVVAEALRAASFGRLKRISLASNGIGPRAVAELVDAAVGSGVEALDLGRVGAAGVLAAPDNRVDAQAAADIGDALTATGSRLAHLVLADCGIRSAVAVKLLEHLGGARTRVVLGKGIATTVRRRFAAHADGLPLPLIPDDVAAVKSVYRTAG
jgi:hypothetical protein